MPISDVVREALASSFEEDSIVMYSVCRKNGSIANQIWRPEPNANGAVLSISQYAQKRCR